jgi:hypothetical protein
MSITPYVPPVGLSSLPRGNMLLWSQDFTNGAWGSFHTTLTDNVTAGPIDGLTTASISVPDTSSNFHSIFQNAAILGGQAYTFSLYVKPAGYNCGVLYVRGGGSDAFSCTFDASIPAVSPFASGAGVVIDCAATPVGGGWSRISVTGRFPTSLTAGFDVGFADNGGIQVFAGDGTSGLYIWGAQLEPYNSASAYAYTTTAADPGIWAGVQSLPVLPFLPGQSPLVSKAPLWSTEKIRTASGRERTTSYWPYPLWQFELQYEVIRHRPANDELLAMWEFFNVAKGQFAPWLFVDPSECYVPPTAPAAFGLGDGVSTTWQLQRPMRSYSEPVFDVYSPIVLDAGALSGPYTISPNGVITFAMPPASGHLLTWFGYYYFGCRFLTDDLSFEQIVTQLWSGKSLKFNSIRV